MEIDFPIANAITAIGHMLTMWWLMDPRRWYICVAGLIFDKLDGWYARWSDTASEFGSQYDWLVDCTIASIIAYRLSPYLIVPLVLMQVHLREIGKHVSGRAFLSMIYATTANL